MDSTRSLTRRRPTPRIIHITPHNRERLYRPGKDMTFRDLQRLRVLLNVLFAEDRDPVDLGTMVAKCGEIDIRITFFP